MQRVLVMNRCAGSCLESIVSTGNKQCEVQREREAEEENEEMWMAAAILEF
jgi:hypothetical protein